MRQALPVETGRRLLGRVAEKRSTLFEAGITPKLWFSVFVANALLVFLSGATDGLRSSLAGRVLDRIVWVLIALTFIALVWISFFGVVRWLEGLGAKRRR